MFGADEPTILLLTSWAIVHRLAQYGAGRYMDYEEAEPETLAAEIAAELAHLVSYRPVETDGAGRAAACLAELI